MDSTILAAYTLTFLAMAAGVLLALKRNGHIGKGRNPR
jgi:hypothetical protein